MRAPAYLAKAAAGLAAGVAGTAALTLTRAIQHALQRQPILEPTPAEAVEKNLPLKSAGETERTVLAQTVHWGYGALWGLAPAVLDLAHVRRTAAVAVIETAAIQSAAMVMLPRLHVAPPVKEWPKREMASELFHHALYATVAAITYHALAPRIQERFPEVRPLLPPPVRRVAAAAIHQVGERVRAARPPGRRSAHSPRGNG